MERRTREAEMHAREAKAVEKANEARRGHEAMLAKTKEQSAAAKKQQELLAEESRARGAKKQVENLQEIVSQFDTAKSELERRMAAHREKLKYLKSPHENIDLANLSKSEAMEIIVELQKYISEISTLSLAELFLDLMGYLANIKIFEDANVFDKYRRGFDPIKREFEALEALALDLANKAVQVQKELAKRSS